MTVVMCYFTGTGLDRIIIIFIFLTDLLSGDLTLHSLAPLMVPFPLSSFF